MFPDNIKDGHLILDDQHLVLCTNYNCYLDKGRTM